MIARAAHASLDVLSNLGAVQTLLSNYTQTVVSYTQVDSIATDGSYVYMSLWDGIDYIPASGTSTSVTNLSPKVDTSKTTIVRAAGGGVFWNDDADVYGIRFP